MAGYTRQSEAQIVDAGTINADDFNNEYNQLVNAFDESTGHTHDGTAAEGALVPLISSSDGLNKAEANGTDNTIDISVDVASVATKQVSFGDGVILPTVTNDVDLGSVTFQFKDLHLAGAITADSISLATATVTSAAISGGTLDGVTIGGTTPAAATVTSLTATTADINGGAIDGTAVGASVPSSGAFTSLTSTSATVNGNIAVTGTVDGRDVAADGTKLDGIEPLAEVNENSFQTIVTTATGTGVASGGNVVADTTTDTLNLVAGDDITITNDPATDTITIKGTAGPTNAVAGPASAVNLNVAVFDGTTGKLIADGGQTIAEIIASVPELSPVKLHFLANS